MTFSSESDEPDPSKALSGSNLVLPSSSPLHDARKEIETKEKPPTPSLFACAVENCEAKYTRLWRLNSHILAKHSGERPFKCFIKGCGKTFTSSSHLRRHTTSAHRPSGVSPVTIKCSYPGCKAELKSKTIERRHYRRAHGPSTYSCSYCSTSFNKRSKLKAHLYIHTGVPSLRCDQCDLNFASPAEYQKHEKSHQMHVCPESGCGMSFRTWLSFRKHHRLKHQPRAKGNPKVLKMYVCKVDNCQATYARLSNLNAHISEKHQGETQYECTETQEKGKKYACKVENCKAVFSRPWRLSAHNAAKHSGERPFKCDLDGCEKTYTSSSHLRRHKATAHRPSGVKEVTYKCSFPGCNKEMKSKDIEKKHYKRAHLCKGFCCPDCPSSFKKRSQLKSHLFFHTGIPEFRCDMCDLNFTSNFEFSRHKKRHKLHVCPKRGCAMTFDTWSAFRKHYGLEHKPPFKCGHCGKMFRIKADLRKHIETTHLLVFTRSKKQDPVHNFECDLCGRFFTTKGSVKRHVEVVHLRQGRKRKERATVRARRKDKGLPRKSIAPALSGLENLPTEIIKGLLQFKEPVPVDEIIVNDLLTPPIPVCHPASPQSSFPALPPSSISSPPSVSSSPLTKSKQYSFPPRSTSAHPSSPLPSPQPSQSSLLQTSSSQLPPVLFPSSPPPSITPSSTLHSPSLESFQPPSSLPPPPLSSTSPSIPSPPLAGNKGGISTIPTNEVEDNSPWRISTEVSECIHNESLLPFTFW